MMMMLRRPMPLIMTVTASKGDDHRCTEASQFVAFKIQTQCQLKLSAHEVKLHTLCTRGRWSLAAKSGELAEDERGLGRAVLRLLAYLSWDADLHGPLSTDNAVATAVAAMGGVRGGSPCLAGCFLATDARELYAAPSHLACCVRRLMIIKHYSNITI
jgi:hypothetical protein